jgi:signal transduction histidine kinase
MLHKNLDVYLKDSIFEQEKFYIEKLLYEQITFFSSLYDYLDWQVDIQNQMLYSNQNALSRIIYNLLSNASKYNTSNGFIKIRMHENRLEITNSSYGIKNPSKLFERFYKESDRGLGIGLHIVEKLCTELEIKKSLTVKNKIVTVTLFF